MPKKVKFSNPFAALYVDPTGRVQLDRFPLCRGTRKGRRDAFLALRKGRKTYGWRNAILIDLNRSKLRRAKRDS